MTGTVSCVKHRLEMTATLPIMIIKEKHLCDVQQSPGEIKRREVSWTLRKKLDTFAGPGKIRGGRWCWTLKGKDQGF